MSDLVTLSLTTLHFHHQITCLSPGAMWWMVAIFSVPLAIPLAALLMLVIAAKTHVLWMCVFWFLFCPLHKHHDHIFENLVIENNFFFSYFLFFILCFFSLVIAQTRYKERNTYYLFNHVDLNITYHSVQDENWSGAFSTPGGRILCK